MSICRMPRRCCGGWNNSGLDVGNRWDELADKAEARIGEAGHLLLVPHLMLALAATGRDDAAARFLAALSDLAADPRLWTAPAIADVVIPACEAAPAHRRRRARPGRRSLLEPRQDQIRLLGGSNAQRDLFFQMLINSAMKADRGDVVSAMVAHETATAPCRRTAAGYAAAARWLHS